MTKLKVQSMRLEYMAYSRDDIMHAYSQFSIYYLLGRKDKAAEAFQVYMAKCAFTYPGKYAQICNN